MKFTAEQEKNICCLYQKDKFNGYQIAKIYHTYPHAIYRVLEKNNVKRYLQEEQVKKYHANKNAFNDLAREETAYWLGFIFADGHVHNRRRLQINLAIKDKELVVRLQSFLKTESPVFEVLNIEYPQVRFSVSDFDIGKRLCELGMEDKDFRVITSAIPRTSLSHFIRGFFDGDGSVNKRIAGKYREAVSFVGSCQFMSWLRDTLAIMAETNPKRKIQKNSKSDVYYLTFCGRKQCLKVHDFLYKNATIYLERKKQTFDTYLQTVWTKTEIHGERQSHFRGVSFSDYHKKWISQIYSRGKHSFLGYFDKEEDAALAYDKKAKELRGRDAFLNFPE